MNARIVPCAQGGDLCCMEDQDDPCFVPFIGPSKRPVNIRYSARFTQQVRRLSGDHRWPMACVIVAARNAPVVGDGEETP